MKQPVKDKFQEYKAKIYQALDDIILLLDTYPEEEVKEDVLNLLADIREYRKKMKALVKKLEAQKGFDHLYVNPKYKETYNPTKF